MIEHAGSATAGGLHTRAGHDLTTYAGRAAWLRATSSPADMIRMYDRLADAERRGRFALEVELRVRQIERLLPPDSSPPAGGKQKEKKRHKLKVRRKAPRFGRTEGFNS
jgi:hypothetical protein